jgi:uncharacterized 2Fe-2S/4Fe-4S cluster protein (DUF4445 family)
MSGEKHDTKGSSNVHVIFKEADAGQERVGTVPAGSTILQAAIAAGIPLQSTCGGKGTCGKCRIILKETDRTGPLPEESKFLSTKQILSGVALACKRTVNTDTTVFLIQQKDVFDRKTKLEKDLVYDLSPLVQKHFLNVPVPSTSDQRSDWERLTAQLPLSEKLLRFDRGIAAKLPKFCVWPLFK